MNYHKQSSFLIFLALLLLFCSCKKKYPNEDLIIRYTVENAKRFENKNEFSVLIIRTPLLSCAAGLENHDYKSILSETKKTLLILFSLFPTGNLLFMTLIQFYTKIILKSLNVLLY